MNKLQRAQELKTRGLITHKGGGTLEDIVSKKRTMYLGVDPTADSLHAGNLVPIILLKHLSDLGNEPMLLVGGATGLIGDPRESGQRKLLDERKETGSTFSLSLTKSPRTNVRGLLYTPRINISFNILYNATHKKISMS